MDSPPLNYSVIYNVCQIIVWGPTEPQLLRPNSPQSES